MQCVDRAFNSERNLSLYGHEEVKRKKGRERGEEGEEGEEEEVKSGTLSQNPL